ncbi:MAG: sugar phosphate isomerase/epimerase [Bacteroidetes bacterium]|nr:sugar phosphate isomerase/epimerase [Bacteroidota bacterium]
MQTRREFIACTASLAAGSLLFANANTGDGKVKNAGVQLYSFRNEMLADATGTLKKIASLGIKQIESAGSSAGHYYGLSAGDMKKACEELGMHLRSGHVHIDEHWLHTIDEAAASGQEYLICSTMPTNGQAIENYKKVAAKFNKAGEDCAKRGIKFGYHNHEYEFETDQGQVLYDILLDNTDPALVHMELDLGWVIVGGKDPLDYFNRYKGRFPLWHLKDMNLAKKQSTEFGKGSLDIPAMLKQRKQAGLKYFFIEQEEYASTPFESMQANMDYLSHLSV